MNAPVDIRLYERARLSRDARFDGHFFTAVLSTGIYCRPICPARPPRADNVRYYATSAAAEAAGYRPCLRCRPELAPAVRGPTADPAIDHVLRHLAFSSIHQIAQQLDMGERQLRRRFIAQLGVTPAQFMRTQRLLWAKQLLTDTPLRVTDVAFAVGFSSQRRFNSAFLEAYGVAPTQLRKSLALEHTQSVAQPVVLKLMYRPPYDFEAILSFLAKRAIRGLESVDGQQYRRLLGVGERAAWLAVSPWPGQHALRLHIVCDNLPWLRQMLVAWVEQVKRMFDLAADPAIINQQLSQCEWLAGTVRQHPGIRLPQAWDPFELAVRAVIGQQISVAAATTIVSRLVARLGETLATPDIHGLNRLFPTAEAICEGDLEGLGITATRCRVLKALAQAFSDGQLDFSAAQSLDEFLARLVAIPGIGPWTAGYIALRGWGHPDVLLASDLVIRRSSKALGGPFETAQIEQELRVVRPWRGYATLQLWHCAGLSDT